MTNNEEAINLQKQRKEEILRTQRRLEEIMSDPSRFRFEWKQKDRKKLQKDWNAQFPTLAPTKKHVGRIVGPLRLSIICEIHYRDDPVYQVYTAVHNLAEHCIGLTATVQSKHFYIYHDEAYRGGEPVPPEKKHGFRHIEVAKELRQEAWIPLEGPLTLDDIWKGYDNFSRSKLGLRSHDVIVPTYVASWAARPDKAREYFDWAMNYLTMCGWKDDITRECEEKMLYAIANPDKLRQTVREEVIKHKLQDTIYEDIVDAAYKEE